MDRNRFTNKLYLSISRTFIAVHGGAANIATVEALLLAVPQTILRGKPIAFGNAILDT